MNASNFVQSSCAAIDGGSSSATRTQGASHDAENVAKSRSAGRQVHAKPADDVREVALSLAQVRILDAVEDRAEVIEHLLQRPLRVDALLADDRCRPRQEHRIVDHQPLRFEQRPQVAAGQTQLNAIELRGRPLARVLQPGDLGADLRGGDRKPEHLRPLNEHDGAARSRPARHADAA